MSLRYTLYIGPKPGPIVKNAILRLSGDCDLSTIYNITAVLHRVDIQTQAEGKRLYV